jgi:hypothetical protein
MGLLERAVSGDYLPKLHHDNNNSPFREEMGLLKAAPSFLKWIVESWNIPQAVLLAYEEDTDSFIPVETVGFDVTTRRRLIIEKQRAIEWLKGETFFHLKDKSHYSTYFSSREVGLSNSLMGISCCKNKDPFALVLLLLDEGDYRTIRKENLSALENEEIIQKLYKALNPSESSGKSLPKIQERSDLQKKIMTEGEEHILLKLNISSLLKLALVEDPLKEHHDKRKEILFLFTSFFNERISLFLDEGENIYILHPQELFPGIKLMENQLYLGLKQLLGENVSSDHVQLNLLDTPLDRKALDHFLEI